MGEMDKNLMKAIKHYQNSIDKYTENRNDSKLLHCIQRLQNLPIQVCHLEETGVGRTVNGLRKLGGDVGEASKRLVSKWKEMVVAHSEEQEQEQEEEEEEDEIEIDNDNDDDDDDDRRQVQSIDNREDGESDTENVPDTKQHNRNKERHRSSEEEEEQEEDDEEEDNRKEDEEERQKYKHKHKEKSDRKRDEEKEKRSKHSHKKEHREHERSSSSSKHKSSRHDKSSNNINDETIKSSSNHSNSSNHNHSSSHHSSSHKSHKKHHQSNSDSDEPQQKQHRRETDTHNTTKSSSSSTNHRHHEYDDNHSSSKEKKSKKRHRSEDDVASKKSHSESSTNLNNNNNNSSSNNNNNNNSDNGERKSKKHKKDKESSDEKKRDKKTKESTKRKSSEHDQKSSSSSNKKSKHRSNTGIDSYSGASFAEALGMCEPSSSSSSSISKQKKHRSGGDDEKVAVMYKEKTGTTSTSSTSTITTNNISNKIIPEIPKPNDPVDINLSSLLPPITPNYRPLGNMTLSDLQTKRSLNDYDALSTIITSKNQRTKVYSGNKCGYTKIPSLFELCIRILQDNIDALEYTGGVPYLILKPILEKATPTQLFNMEHHNPYLIDDTDNLWQLHCQREFRNKQREELETWREMYMRCLDEREAKLKALTANIKQAQDKSQPIRTTKLAYVDDVVKPPRNIARKQAKNAAVLDKRPAITPSTRLNMIASSAAAGEGSAKVSVPNPGSRAADRSGGSHHNVKTKKAAPLMAKTLSMCKNRFKR